MELLGIRLVGFNATRATRSCSTIGLIVVLWLLRSAVLALLGRVHASGDRASRIAFWSRQGVSLVMAAFAVIGFVSIWFDDPARLTTAVGLVTAGLAFALQKVVTALAGYFVILRGKTFTVGDRITMGGVRGDVIALGFIQTTIMEMGQPPPVQNADPAMWVQQPPVHRPHRHRHQRQDLRRAGLQLHPRFPVIWEEMRLPISYRDDRKGPSRSCSRPPRGTRSTRNSSSRETIERPNVDFRVRREDFAPRTYWRLTDNWLELTVRFVARTTASAT